MARQRRMLGGMFESSWNNKLVVIGLLVLFIMVGVFIYYQYNQSALDKKGKDIANANGRAGEAKPAAPGAAKDKESFEDGVLDVMFFNADWCPHCVRAKPEWEQYVAKYDGKVFHGYTVSCVGGKDGINCTNTDKPDVKASIERYNIQHYPTLIFVQNGSRVEFDAKINQKNLDDFMEKL